jgi:4-alpha-glucanotransferase
MDDTRFTSQLYRLARLYNMQTAFYGVRHHRHTAGVDSLLAVLQALGAPMASLSDVASALRERTQAVRRQIIEPVTVAWNGERPVIHTTLPDDIAGATWTVRLELESGESSDWKVQPGDLPVIESSEIEGRRYVVRQLTLPEGLPFGYHKFIFQVKGKSGESMIISAPHRTFSPDNGKNTGSWGAFLPLYALKTEQGWGSGDYSGLGAMVDWVAGKGGNCVGTLPLLPVFLDRPYDPSPYAPVSRLLWNEFYIDINKIPELSRCQSAQELLQSASFAAEIASLRGQALVDYRGIMSLKRKVLEQLSKCLSDSGTARLGEFKRFARENPVVEDYARFRAVMEKQNTSWQLWPPWLRDGDLREGDGDEDVKNYYLYAQWQARQQVRELAEKSRQKDVTLYFDLPLGVHPDGFDAWRYRDIFVTDVAAGAPPDPVFTTGQNWGFPPIHPEKIRAQGYRYVIEYLRHHLQHAAMLRVDHVMGLHRLYWIPRGLDGTQGIYVRYRAEELYAILAVESHRHRSIIVGEDLGIVPGYIRSSMSRHGLHRMYILYYELADSAAPTLRRIPRNCIAGLNTHDMPPFASFWEGADIREKVSLGLLNEKEAGVEKEARLSTKTALTSFLSLNGFLKKAGNGTRSAYQACLAYLSSTRAHTVLLNEEDLWQETRAQNIPGSGAKFPSWRRKARYTLEEFCRMNEVSDILREVDTLRKNKDKH